MCDDEIMMLVSGSPCRHDEFQCASLNQCIPRSFHCDMELDCQDRSDEIGCCKLSIDRLVLDERDNALTLVFVWRPAKPTILIPPPPMVMVNLGTTIIINCTAVGVPTPEVVWRLNWGHVPSKCSMTSESGFGVLTCHDAQIIDQGAYSCEAINAKVLFKLGLCFGRLCQKQKRLGVMALDERKFESRH